jgi:rubrerythrin
MTVTFDAIGALKIAERIERNGAVFYRRAAAMFDAPAGSGMFLSLAKWEEKHEQVFARMRAQLSKPAAEPGPSGGERALPDPQVMAGLAVFGIRSDPAEELYGDESEADILRKALQKEKDSIVFYYGLKDFVPAEADKSKIDIIIREEMRHIRVLDELLRQKQ